jgi:hypothetical protein
MPVLQISPEMKKPLTASAILHVAIIIFATVGLPFIIPPKTMNIPVGTINIEFATPAELTAAKELPKPKPAPVQEEKPKPAPQMDAEAPPDLSQEKPKPVEKEKQPEAKPDVAPELEAPKEEPKPEEKPKPPETKPEVTREAPKEQEKDFQSLLKNLVPDADAEKQPDNATSEDSESNEDVANLADKLTYSEVDAVRAQLAGCWNVMSGAQYAEDLIVQVKLHMNPDRTVRKATIVDTGRYNRDTFFRAAADSALRALRNPNCIPLKLPEDKYNEWKVTIINFDPREML